MKFTIERDEFLAALNTCKPAADKRSTMPILSCALIKATAPSVTVTATDLSMIARSTKIAEVEASGALAVNLFDLLERVKAMPAGLLSIEEQPTNKLQIKGGKARRFVMHSLPAEEYPDTAEGGDYKTRAVEREALAELFACTRYAASADVTRPHLFSVLVEFDPKKLVATTTDGHRLAHREIEGKFGKGTEAALVPSPGVSAIQKVLEAYEGEANPVLGVHEGWFIALLGFDEIRVRLTDAQFPPWQQVVPDPDTGTVFEVDRDEFIDALEAVRLARGLAKGVSLDVSEDDQIKIQGEDFSGEGFDAVAATLKSRKSSDVVGVNPAYLIDALKACHEGTVTLELRGSLDPITVRGQPGYLAVVMPSRL